MNLMRSYNGKNMVLETNLEESKLLLSLLEFVSQYKRLHPEHADRISSEEITFALNLGDEFEEYITEDGEWTEE